MTDLAYCLPGIGWACWCVGGWRWKWIRRYLMPILFGWVASVYGVPTKNILLAILLMMFSLSLGYGEGKSWWWRFFVGCMYSLSSLTIGGRLTNVNTTIWLCLVTLPFVFVGLFWLSLKKGLQWKIVEGLTGAMMGWIVKMILMS